MRKKFLIAILFLACACSSVLAFASCGGSGGSLSSNSASSGNNEQQPTEYTVTYDGNGGVFEDGKTTFTQTAEKNATIIAPTAPTRENYVFGGWAKDVAGNEKWNFATDTVTGNVTLYATWSQETAILFSVEGASLEGTEIFMFVEKDVETVSLASKVVCSGDSVWKLYYDQLGQTEIPTKIAADKTGELLDGDNTFYIVVSSQNGAQVNTYELTVHRSYAVDVKYYDGETLLKTETAYTGHEYATDYLPELTGYTFNGWNYETKILWEGLVLYADKTANTYTLTYQANGGELDEEEKTVAYGDEFTLAKPTKTGHTFLGWYDGETPITDEEGKSLAVWDYTQNLVAKAKWQANNYAVDLTANNEAAGTIYGGGDHAYGEAVTISAKTNEGYTWLGWYDENGELVTRELSYEFTMGFATSYAAKWSKVAVEAETGGRVSLLNGTYKFGQEVIVTATTYLGYVFGGWYNGENKLTSEKSYVFTMPEESVTYTAKWTLAEEMQNFVFTSTETDCMVRGVKDGTVTEIVVPNYVTYIQSGAFKNCMALTSIQIPFIGSSAGATNSSGVFGNIFGYTVYNSKAPYYGMTDICQYFDESVSPKEYYFYQIPQTLRSVTVTGGRISANAFYNCSFLENVTFGKDGAYAGDGVYVGEYAFYNCKGLKEIVLPSAVTSIGNYAFEGCVAAETITLGCDLTSIGEYAFKDCEKVKIMEIPATVKKIGQSVFSGCGGLESLSLPFVGCTVTKDNGNWQYPFGYIFGEGYYANCVAAQQEYWKVGARNTTYTAVTYCLPSSLRSVTVLGGEIEDYVFIGCTNIENVDVPAGATKIGTSAFAGCEKLAKIVVPDSVKTIGASAFSSCKALQKAVIGKGVAAIPDYAFGGCQNLTDVQLSEELTTIGKEAFNNCQALKNITIPNGVTTILKEAFRNCYELESVVLPKSLTTLGTAIFGACYKLTSVYYTGTEEEWNTLNIDYITQATVYYYSEEEPTAEGNYWYYDTDGVTPVVRTKNEE